MKARRYEPDDFAQIEHWGQQWGAKYTAEQLPKVGFIVDDTAAYFLYQTDSSCCWLENMICNKYVDKKIVDEALSLIVDAILQEAQTLGFRVAYATTNNVDVALRAKKYGAFIKPLQMQLTKILSPS